MPEREDRIEAVIDVVAELRERGWVVGLHGVYVPDHGPIGFNVAVDDGRLATVLAELGFELDHVVRVGPRAGIFPPA